MLVKMNVGKRATMEMARKALGAFMALVLAFGLMPVSCVLAWAASSQELTIEVTANGVALDIFSYDYNTTLKDADGVVQDATSDYYDDFETYTLAKGAAYSIRITSNDYDVYEASFTIAVDAPDKETMKIDLAKGSGGADPDPDPDPDPVPEPVDKYSLSLTMLSPSTAGYEAQREAGDTEFVAQMESISYSKDGATPSTQAASGTMTYQIVQKGATPDADVALGDAAVAEWNSWGNKWKAGRASTRCDLEVGTYTGVCLKAVWAIDGTTQVAYSHEWSIVVSEAQPVTAYKVEKGEENAQQGTFSINKEQAEEDEIVTVTVSPAEGKAFDHLELDGAICNNAWSSEANKWKFRMPAKDTVVTAVFKDVEKIDQTISAHDVELRLGDAPVEIGATAVGELTYASSDPAVATVSADGKVTAVGIGTTTVTISAGGSATVNPASTDISVKVLAAVNGLIATAVGSPVEVPYSQAERPVAAELLYSISSADGDVVFVKKSGSPALKVSAATGAVSVAAGTAPGNYAADVIVLAAGDGAHEAKCAVVPVSITVTKASIDGAKLELDNARFVCNGKVQKPAVVKVGDASFDASEFTVSYANADSRDEGVYLVSVTAKGANFEGKSAPASYKIVKAANALSVKSASKSLAFKKVKKGKGKIAATVYRAAAGQGAMEYRISSQVNAKTKKSVKLFSVNKNGVVSVSKKAPKGSYRVTVSVSASGDAVHEASGPVASVITVKVK